MKVLTGAFWPDGTINNIAWRYDLEDGAIAGATMVEVAKMPSAIKVAYSYDPITKEVS